MSSMNQRSEYGDNFKDMVGKAQTLNAQCLQVIQRGSDPSYSCYGSDSLSESVQHISINLIAVMRLIACQNRLTQKLKSKVLIS